MSQIENLWHDKDGNDIRHTLPVEYRLFILERRTDDIYKSIADLREMITKQTDLITSLVSTIGSSHRPFTSKTFDLPDVEFGRF